LARHFERYGTPLPRDDWFERDRFGKKLQKFGTTPSLLEGSQSLMPDQLDALTRFIQAEGGSAPLQGATSAGASTPATTITVPSVTAFLVGPTTAAAPAAVAVEPSAAPANPFMPGERHQAS
jgi:hypothetical protein